jgi:hypothetical protein
MILVNFTHPLTAEQREEIERLAGHTIERVIDAPARFDESSSYAEQIAALVASVGLSAEEWQTLPLLVNPPAFAPIVAGTLAYLHGVMGHFPAIIRLRPVAGSAPTRFEAAEVIGLDEIRAVGRTSRF